ncbi:MAG: prephenate dehydratase [Candidatus Omnitrophica bacterium]|nr:prephenate dehydratase [Candidatus Omnitrophota bacterium]MDD5352328.1 prephenate dehydratase [Candidatus Omnitrophota bacterium]MDD5549926.1 prephenate dehydratase [Candidatus Omnitrophota bacterium]
MQIKNIRKRIDSLDRAIIGLLNKRAGLSKEIGSIKRKLDKETYAPDREKEVITNIKKMNKGPMANEALNAIYREIMSSSLSLEKPLTIAYLGPQATFTHLAALHKFGSMVSYSSCDSISEVFLDVERGNSDYGVVPIENSIEGAVSHTLDMFMDSDLKICAEIMLNITHNLLANCRLKDIKKVYSKLEVFGQCRIWLQVHLPKAELIEVSSTTKAAQIASKEKNAACIASTLAAKVYDLKIIAKEIEDSPHNITRFLVISKNDVMPTKEDKTSIMFSIKDKVGALHDMLVPFKKYKINLTKIESRPSKKRAWDYYFYLDLSGHKDDSNVKKALQELDKKCKFLKILGSYPRCE